MPLVKCRERHAGRRIPFVRVRRNPFPRLQEDGGRADRWLAPDKARHFMMSFAVVGYSFAALRTAGVRRPRARTTAILVAAGSGLGKELSDRMRGRGFSFRDLAWDAAGVIAGALLIQNTR